MTDERLNALVEDDPTRPYKTYAAMGSALIVSLLTTLSGLPTFVVVFLTVVGTGLAVYSAPNPKRKRRIAHKPRRKAVQ